MGFDKIGKMDTDCNSLVALKRVVLLNKIKAL